MRVASVASRRAEPDHRAQAGGGEASGTQ